ncbi:MAG: hypothetical protein U0168_20940 [Nannocystaceae bacterium]|jgi:hypothetical protein
MSSPYPTAATILVTGGVLNLVLSFALGWVLSAARMRRPITELRWLLTAHEVALQEGLMLLGLAFALGFASMPPAWAERAAWLLVVASGFQDGSGIANWLRSTGDQFAERSLGWVLASINAVLNTAGLAIIAWGVLSTAMA